MTEIQIGTQMHWHRHVGSYGFLEILKVTVRKIGRRITVEVPLMSGGTRLTVVKPESLREIPSTDKHTSRTETST